MQTKPHGVKTKSKKMVILCLSVLLVLACTLVGGPQIQPPDPSLVETEIALRVISTSLAGKDLTRQAMETALAQQQIPALPPTPMNLPQQSIQPSPVPARTIVQSPVELVLELQTSVDAFYCYQAPSELTITVRVSDINRGMAVYYHIQDKITGVESDGQVLDLHRRSSDTRRATIVGGFSEEMNLQFPPLMGESYFLYQIISDDGKYRTPVYSDVTFFPCAQ